MHVYGIQCHNKRANEIKLFDEALSNSCDEVQAISIKLIDKFFGQKADFIMNLKQSFQSMCKSTDDDIATHRNHIHTIGDNFAKAVDSIWYTLIELETSLHERIMDSMKIFNDTIRTIIENFNDKSTETFDRIRSACDAYFQSIIDTSAIDASEQRHINIINHKLDLMCSRANKWLSKTIEGYELQVFCETKKIKVSFSIIHKVKEKNIHFFWLVDFFFLHIQIGI